VESTSSGKHHRINALASEVARHQQFKKSADFQFNSRRLHHLLVSLVDVVGGEGLSRKFRLRLNLAGPTPAASNIPPNFGALETSHSTHLTQIFRISN
jgi:hypothetical protein